MKRNIYGIEPEMVDDYSVALGKLYRWLLLALDLRVDDVVKRLEKTAKLREERELAIEASENREQQMQVDIETAKAEFEAKMEAEQE